MPFWKCPFQWLTRLIKLGLLLHSSCWSSTEIRRLLPITFLGTESTKWPPEALQAWIYLHRKQMSSLRRSYRLAQVQGMWSVRRLNHYQWYTGNQEATAGKQSCFSRPCSQWVHLLVLTTVGEKNFVTLEKSRILWPRRHQELKNIWENQRLRRKAKALTKQGEQCGFHCQ